MGRTIETYLDRVAGRLQRPGIERPAIVAELRNHLHEKAKALRRHHPDRDAEDIEREVVSHMPAVQDLVLAYGPGGGMELRDAEGRTVFRFSDAVGRTRRQLDAGARAIGHGTGRALRTTFLTFLVLFGLVLVAFTAMSFLIYDDVIELVQGHESEPVHTTAKNCQTACHDRSTPTFYVHPEARMVRFDLDLHPAGGNGTFSVTVRDPTGAVLLDRMLPAGQTGDRYDTYTWAPVPGNWQIEYHYDGFTGRVWSAVMVTGSAR